jgi:dUTPase
MKLRIQKTHPSARVPEYMTEGAAAFDLYAATVNGMEWV